MIAALKVKLTRASSKIILKGGQDASNISAFPKEVC